MKELYVDVVPCVCSVWTGRVSGQGSACLCCRNV